MSVFDEERKKLGITSTSRTSGSAFDSERIELGLMRDPGTPMSDLMQKYSGLTATKILPKPEPKKIMSPDDLRQSRLEFSKMIHDNISNTPATAYSDRMNYIAASNSPAPVKAFSRLMTELFYNTDPGKFISRTGSKPHEIQSGGNSTIIRPELDSDAANIAADVLGSVLSLAVPTGAPPGVGPLAAPYKSADALLSTNKGMAAERALTGGLSKVMKPGTAQAVSQGALREGIAGTVQGPALALMNNQSDNAELAKASALGGVAGFGLGGAVPAAIAPIKSMVNNRAIGKALEQGIQNTELPVIPGPGRAAEAAISPGTQADDFINRLRLEPRSMPDDPVLTAPRITEPPITTQTRELPAQEIPQALPVERGFAATLKTSTKTPAEFSERLNSTYTPITNAETVQKANVRIADDVDEATRFVLSDSRFDADKSVTAQRLIDHYNQQGNYQMAVSIADKVATEATKAGQAIQALSIYNRLTPEGILIHAKQLANKINENTPKFAKEAVITDNMAADLTKLAATTQKMTGVKNLSNDVMDILERAKTGEKLSTAETDQLRRFVNESKQFIKDATKPVKPPKAPRSPKDKRVREAVTTFLDAQEQAAKERLRARGIQVSSMPLDVWADYAVIGASKMGKGIVKFADWSEAMVKELGEEIRPMLEQLYDRARETFEQSTKKITNQTISNAERLTEKIIKTKELSPDEADQLMLMAQRVSSLSGEERRLASQDLQAILQQLDRPTVLKKISTAQTMGQLLNPKTHVRNVVGNELFYRVERLNKVLSTPIDIARSKITGGDRYVTFRTHNQGQFWKNFMEGAKAGWRGVNINGLQTQFDLTSQAFRGKYNPMAYLEKTLGAALRGFDNAAYMRAYNNTLGELGTLDAINRGIKPTKEYVQRFIAKADENIMQIADEYGKYVTFQDNNALSKALSATKRGLNFQKDFGIGDLILKYPKTPGALLMRALEYSPAGFLRSASILAKPILKRGAEAAPAEATQALSRAIIGTFGFTGLGYFLMDKGIITGDASRDRDIRSLEQAAGKGAYQVNLSALERFVTSGFDSDEATVREGDLLYTYDWAQPVSVGIAMGANMRNSKDDEKETAVGLGMNLLNNVSSGVNTLTDQSVLQGIARAAEGYPGQTVSDKIMDVLSDIPSSFTPSMLNQIKQMTDNTRRETYSPNKLEQSLNKAQAKIPGLAQQLPAQFDTLGNEKQTYQDNNWFNVLLNPGFASRYQLSPEARLIVDLITETGDESLAPRVPSKSIQGNKLTGEQFSRYSQLQGEETRERLSKIDPDLSTKSKIKRVEKTLTKASEKAKKQMIKENDFQKVK